MIRAHFASQHPHDTWWLVVEYPVETPPAKLFEDLAAAGWEENKFYAPASPLDGRQQVNIMSPGSGSFNAWTGTEATEKLAACRSILRKYGLNAPHYKLKLQDML